MNKSPNAGSHQQVFVGAECGNGASLPQALPSPAHSQAAQMLHHTALQIVGKHGKDKSKNTNKDSDGREGNQAETSWT